MARDDARALSATGSDTGAMGSGPAGVALDVAAVDRTGVGSGAAAVVFTARMTDCVFAPASTLLPSGRGRSCQCLTGAGAEAAVLVFRFVSLDAAIRSR